MRCWGEAVRWSGGSGVGAGIDAAGGLRVRFEGGEGMVLSAGEVHLGGRLPEGVRAVRCPPTDVVPQASFVRRAPCG